VPVARSYPTPIYRRCPDATEPAQGVIEPGDDVAYSAEVRPTLGTDLIAGHVSPGWWGADLRRRVLRLGRVVGTA
jgi:hypothetical protein